MRRLFAGIAFLSRVPVPGAATFDAAEVGRATLTFPVVGSMGANTEACEVRVFVVRFGGEEG